MRHGSGEVTRLMARGAVVLSAGAVNTPRLLQLSGIGDAACLGALGLAVVTLAISFNPQALVTYAQAAAATLGGP